MKNAFKSALRKFRSLLPSSTGSTQKKKSDPHRRDRSSTGETPPKELAHLENSELQFAQEMQKEGVSPAKFVDNKVSKNSLKNIPGQESKKSSSPKQSGKYQVKIKTQKTAEKKYMHHQFGKVVGESVRSAMPPKKTVKSKPNKNSNSPTAPAQAKPCCKITVKDPVTPNPALVSKPQPKKHIVPASDGAAEQIANSRIDDEREVVIGLDFGTASVKVVIGDSALGKAFAVPFSQETGLTSFLLPSLVWKDNEGYSLLEIGIPFRNLKLQLINKSCSQEIFADSAAFLALIIRHARAWLFTEKADIYQNTHILWKLTLGLPAESYDNKELVERFEKLAAAAWWLSRTKEKIIPHGLVEDVCAQIDQNSFKEISERPELNAIDFDVVPELSAQIYGFLTSTQFDPDAKNIFLMVDVGAGTVDSSVFYVERVRGKKLSFEFFTNFVEFNGVSNLHNNRIQWLEASFKKEDVAQDIYNKLSMMQVPTNATQGIPENINDYFDGIEFSFDNHEKCPDSLFFTNRVKKQVLGKTLQNAKNYFSSNDDYSDMPMFLCGGGSRMNYYKKLEDELISHPCEFQTIPTTHSI